MTSKSMKGAPKPLTNEERAKQIAKFLSAKREQYALSILGGLVHNPTLIQMANIREVVNGDQFTHTLSVDLSPAVKAAIGAADALLEELYPIVKEGEKTDGEL